MQQFGDIADVVQGTSVPLHNRLDPFNSKVLASTVPETLGTVDPAHHIAGV